MFLCRVRKSLKRQAFCNRYSLSSLSRMHKHNLCRVGRWFRKDGVRHEPHQSNERRANKQ